MSSTTKARIQFSIDTQENWDKINPKLLPGEFAVARKSSGKYILKIGKPEGGTYNDSPLVWDEQSAEDMMSTMKRYMDESNANKTAAALSESNAGNSAKAAAESQSAAAASESAASAYASSAAASQKAASDSETNARASATAAKDSQTAAASSASAASESATAASSSQQSAAKSETNAANSATKATNSQTAAENSASNAAQSANAADASAKKAATFDPDKYYSKNEELTVRTKLYLSLIDVMKTHYARDKVWSGSKRALITPGELVLNVGGKGLLNNGQRTINIDDAASWDASKYATAANRKGIDFYIYACQPKDGTTVPKFILSVNSTVPSGYTATTSRKIGGFHCLCADVGTISGNALSGYTAGDILPATMWDLRHRPVAAPEGMFYDGRLWVDIYKCSWDGTKLASKFNGVIADGESTKRFSGIGFAEELAKIGKHLPSYDDFVHFAKGVPELRNIKGSADPNTTGGNVNTDGQRIISSYGAEDVAGVEWEFLSDLFGSDFKSDWNHDAVYNNSGLGIDIDRGSCYGGGLRRLLAGGRWVDGSCCGSRSAFVANWGAFAWGSAAARGASEPLAVEL